MSFPSSTPTPRSNISPPPLPSVALRDDINIQRRGILLCIFWSKWKLCLRMLTYSNAHANAKKIFLRFSSQEIGLSLVSMEMIFETRQSELFRFKFHTLISKMLKIPEFNPIIEDWITMELMSWFSSR